MSKLFTRKKKRTGSTVLALDLGPAISIHGVHFETIQTFFFFFELELTDYINLAQPTRWPPSHLQSLVLHQAIAADYGFGLHPLSEVHAQLYYKL
jgi:hypothetical protein